LAQEIAEQRGVGIRYQIQDFLNPILNEKFELIFDKGTFDAISLSPQKDIDQQKYIQSVQELMTPTGYFIITSCNYSTDELIQLFQSVFKCRTFIKYPSFQFGGLKGTTISTVAFVLKTNGCD